MLTVLDHIPDGLLELKATELHTLLSGPTLIHLPGLRQPAMFVSSLLHGNEHSGWEAIRTLLKDYEQTQLPRDVSIFIGNVQAARVNQRFLDGQNDYNRVWGVGDTDEHIMTRRVIDEMKQRGLFLSVDIHNNSGKNPHYACINNTYAKFLRVATLFSSTVVYFIRPKGVQSMAFAELCPAVTVECGTSGAASGTEHALEFLHACLALETISDHAVNRDSFDLYHTVAIVKIRQGIEFGFAPGQFDLTLRHEIETSNFQELPAGTVMGEIADSNDKVLDILDEQGNDVSDQYFSVTDKKLVSRRSLVPAMITTDVDVIRKDCFCYIMEHYPLQAEHD